MSNKVTTKFFEKIASGDLKGAQNAATDYTRITLRDEGILRRVLPPDSLSYSDLDDQLDTDMPVKLVEKEVLQPLSASVPFGTLPANWYMRGDKYRVDFARLVTRNYVIDVAQRQTYNKDITEVFKENAILDMQTAEDVPYVNMLDAITTPVDEGNASIPAWSGPESANPMRSSLTGKIQYYDFSDPAKNPLGIATGWTRKSLVESLKIMTKGFRINEGDDRTPVRNKPAVVLMNVNTGLEFAKFEHDEFGGPGAEDMLKNGVTQFEWLGVKYVFTLKDDIVKDGEAFYLAKEGHLGKFYELDKPTMFVDRRAFMIEYFAYSCIGCSIGNPFGVAKVKYF
jgi:hypothetical protein